MRLAGLFLLFGASLRAQDPRLWVDRLAKHAATFEQSAPSLIAEETLQQNFRPNVPGARFETHEVISMYGFSTGRGSAMAFHEVRKVISVDGRAVTTAGQARQAMTLGLKSENDRLKKRLLEDFEKHGLHGAATDFGQLILLFTPRHTRDFEFEPAGERQIGADTFFLLRYRQKSGDRGVTVFLGNVAQREPLRGEISLRKQDLAPLRLTMTSSEAIRGVPVREESTVEYRLHESGTVVPVSVIHREYIQGELRSENQFAYGEFRKIEPNPQR